MSEGSALQSGCWIFECGTTRKRHQRTFGDPQTCTAHNTTQPNKHPQFLNKLEIFLIISSLSLSHRLFHWLMMLTNSRTNTGVTVKLKRCSQRFLILWEVITNLPKNHDVVFQIFGSNKCTELSYNLCFFSQQKAFTNEIGKKK